MEEAQRAKLLTVKELGKFLDLSERTIRYYAETGEIPAYRVGKHWRFDREAVLRSIFVPMEVEVAVTQPSEADQRLVAARAAVALENRIQQKVDQLRRTEPRKRGRPATVDATSRAMQEAVEERRRAEEERAAAAQVIPKRNRAMLEDHLSGKMKMVDLVEKYKLSSLTIRNILNRMKRKLRDNEGR